MLAPEQHAQLDELYWHSKQTVTSLSAQFGLTSTQLTKLVSPLPSGFNCWWCQQAVVYRKRVERDDAQRRRGHLTCSCGAEQPDSVDHAGLVDTDAAIVAPLFESRERYGWHRRQQCSAEVGPMSDVARRGVQALAEVGLRWAGVFVVVEAFDSLDEVLVRRAGTADPHVGGSGAHRSDAQRGRLIGALLPPGCRRLAGHQRRILGDVPRCVRRLV